MFLVCDFEVVMRPFYGIMNIEDLALNYGCGGVIFNDGKALKKGTVEGDLFGVINFTLGLRRFCQRSEWSSMYPGRIRKYERQFQIIIVGPWDPAEDDVGLPLVGDDGESDVDAEHEFDALLYENIDV